MHSATVVLSLLAAVSAAQPHKHAHQHRHLDILKRENAVKWVTEYEYTTEIIPVTKTIWVSEGFVPPTTSKTTTSSKATVAAQFFQPNNESKSSSTTSVYVAPAPAPTSAAPTSAPAPPPAPAPEPSSTTSSTTTTAVAPVVPAAVAPTSAAPPAPVYTPPAPTTSAAAAPVAASAPSSGSASSGGQCSEGSPCEGDITHYDTLGIGACGWQNDGTTENVMALPHELMGTQSNGNPYCGRTVTVSLNGKTTTAKIVDKCMGCTGFSIDLSDHCFSELAAMDIGRTQASWWFSD